MGNVDLTVWEKLALVPLVLLVLPIQKCAEYLEKKTFLRRIGIRIQRLNASRRNYGGTELLVVTAVLSNWFASQPTAIVTALTAAVSTIENARLKAERSLLKIGLIQALLNRRSIAVSQGETGPTNVNSLFMVAWYVDRGRIISWGNEDEVVGNLKVMRLLVNIGVWFLYPVFAMLVIIEVVTYPARLLRLEEMLNLAILVIIVIESGKAGFDLSEAQGKTSIVLTAIVLLFYFSLLVHRCIYWHCSRYLVVAAAEGKLKTGVSEDEGKLPDLFSDLNDFYRSLDLEANDIVASQLAAEGECCRLVARPRIVYTLSDEGNCYHLSARHEERARSRSSVRRNERKENAVDGGLERKRILGTGYL